ncbi:MAG: sugar phosphate isomerase/epimerase family protein [Chthoniobacteraceae bacterium]
MNSIHLTGFADEAGVSLETQIKATKELGWTNIEMRNVQAGDFPAANLHDIPDAAFELVVEKLAAESITINSFGSAIANGAKKIEDPFETTRAEARRAIPRMQRLGTKLIRIMSYPIRKDTDDQMEPERFRRLRELQQMFSDAGLTLVHENCGNYGGMSWSHTLKLLENVPGLKLVYDTGNPVHDDDYSRPEPRPKQSSWEFYSHVKEHIAYIHVKDGIFDTGNNKLQWCFPGEGQGDVKRILTDIIASGYTGGISIEPHMGPALPDTTLSREQNCYQTYIEYGRRLEKLIASLT